MKLNLFTLAGGNWSVEISPELNIDDLKALARAEAAVPDDHVLKLHGGGRELVDGGKTVAECGLTEGDTVMIESYAEMVAEGAGSGGGAGTSIGIDFGKIAIPNSGSSSSLNVAANSSNNSAPRNAPRPQQSTGIASTSGAGFDVRNGGSEIDQLWSAMASDPRTLSLLKERNPNLADTFVANDRDKFEEILNKQLAERRQQEMDRIRLLSADPFDMEAQRKIHEAIDAENINSVLEHAMEYNPEMFSTVTMLYISCHVNNHPIKAFVDSGAQSTIMSVNCARRCNLLRFVDKRFSGIAKGVGEQKIIGKIHLAQLQIEKDYLPTSFIVLEDQSMEMMLGLDMLKRHQCIIDLKNNCLKIGASGTETRFLFESELPASAHLNPGDGRRSGPASPNPHAGVIGATVSQLPLEPKFPESDIAKIVEMGFDRASTISALTQAGGNSENALAILLAASAGR